MVGIISVVESDENRRFAGEIKTLEELLKPTVSDFAADARIRRQNEHSARATRFGTFVLSYCSLHV